MNSPLDAVLAFCASWESGRPEVICAHLAADARWENGPLAPISGRAAIAARLSEVMALADAIRWEVTEAAVAASGAVLTERIDTIRCAGREIVLPLMGLFRVDKDGIILWRDYFDLASYRAAQGDGDLA